MKANRLTGAFLSLLLIANLAQRAADSPGSKAVSPTNSQRLPGFKIIWPESLEGFKSLQKQAEHGDAESQSVLGNCYYNGQFVPKDLSEAVKWFHKAAERGLAESELSLGWCYYFGEGVAKDEIEAA